MLKSREAKFLSDNAREALDLGETVAKAILQEALVKTGTFNLPSLSPAPTIEEIAAREALCEHMSQQAAAVAAAERSEGLRVSILRDKALEMAAGIAKTAGGMLLQAAVAAALKG